jgi:hypothetical protein
MMRETASPGIRIRRHQPRRCEFGQRVLGLDAQQTRALDDIQEKQRTTGGKRLEHAGGGA